MQEPVRRLKLAIMGIRGIPANYGGFETFAEELAPRLVRLGHHVTVYGRSNIIRHQAPCYKGVRLVILPTIAHKYLDTVAHTFLCALHSVFQGYDAVLICNSVNSIFSILPRLVGQKVSVNVDGLEWKRKKWNWIGKLVYRVSEYLAALLPNNVVTDSTNIQNYYLEKFGKNSTYIPYGAPIEQVPGRGALEKYGLKKGNYILYVSRLEPENNAHMVIRAFEGIDTDFKLVIVGDAPYGDGYIKELKSTKDPRIVFTGYVFNEGYRELQSNAYFYVQATEVGGTHPALLEGMGFGNCVLANEVPEHREVLADAGLYFQGEDDLKDKMQYLFDRPDVISEYEGKAIRRVKENYTWDKVTDRYEQLFLSMLA